MLVSPFIVTSQSVQPSGTYLHCFFGSHSLENYHKLYRPHASRPNLALSDDDPSLPSTISTTRVLEPGYLVASDPLAGSPLAAILEHIKNEAGTDRNIPLMHTSILRPASSSSPIEWAPYGLSDISAAALFADCVEEHRLEVEVAGTDVHLALHEVPDKDKDSDDDDGLPAVSGQDAFGCLLNPASVVWALTRISEADVDAVRKDVKGTESAKSAAGWVAECLASFQDICRALRGIYLFTDESGEPAGPTGRRSMEGVRMDLAEHVLPGAQIARVSEDEGTIQVLLAMLISYHDIRKHWRGSQHGLASDRD